MPQSMTAFARLTTQQDWGKASWELRSVNHRYLETHFRLPDTLRELEMPLRELARKHLHRGKVDISLQLNVTSSNEQLDVNQPLAKEVISACQQVADNMSAPAPTSPLEILRWPGVLQEPEVDQKQLQTDLLTLFEETLQQLAEGRAREGEKLAEIIEQRLAAIEKEVEAVRQVLPELLTAQRQKLHDKLAELKTELDSDRVEQEMVILAQKSDVDEELDRLETHVTEIRRVLRRNEPAGRRLDFLMQELNREANTLGSKSMASSTTQSAVELKVLIEQIREQIQNIE
jgi:uncharacterized protein (TIGR00255 family)